MDTVSIMVTAPVWALEKNVGKPKNMSKGFVEKKTCQKGGGQWVTTALVPSVLPARLTFYYL